MSFYDDASLVLIPSGVKAAKVYSQKPTNGSGDLTFSRASTATRTNASGVIESVASNVPRLDYSGGATCPRLLLEPQRTNLVFPSATATTQTRTVTATAHTLSFYGTGSVTLLGVATGTLTGTGANDRVALTFTPTAGSLVLTVSGTITNWQLEAGAYATSYIPTTTATVTRLVDSFSKSGIASLIGQTGGVIMMDFYYDVALTTGTELLFIRNGLSNYIYRARIGSNGPNIFSVLYNNSGSGRVLVNNITLVPNNRYKIAVVYDYATNTAKTFVNGVLNGTVVGVDPFPTNSQDTLSSGDVLGAAQLKLNQLYLSTEIFSDAAAIQLTTL